MLNCNSWLSSGPAESLVNFSCKGLMNAVRMGNVVQNLIITTRSIDGVNNCEDVDHSCMGKVERNEPYQ